MGKTIFAICEVGWKKEGGDRWIVIVGMWLKLAWPYAFFLTRSYRCSSTKYLLKYCDLRHVLVIEHKCYRLFGQ